MEKPEVVVFVPTEEEYKAVRNNLYETDFENFKARAVLTGPGKISTAAAVAAEAGRLMAKRPRPALVIGAGLCGSLQMKLAAGEAVVSDSSAIGDWIMEDDYVRTYGVYGDHTYKALSDEQAEALAINGGSRIVEELLVRLTAKGFKRGRILTIDTYVTGLTGKLERGRLFNCLASDHESGALGLVALKSLEEVPWLNLRVVSDTIGEQMGGEGRAVSLPEILALKLLVLLSTFDANFPKGSCANCSNPCCPV
ncbi:hypothetical protein C4J81_08955 [Deltaproteobacteria bacterium Smac51]|nr:hypothetical protein C4J81_08955 [Deltaproteobacteria bacterium Smac51]